jgi:hypothetical protein
MVNGGFFIPPLLHIWCIHHVSRRARKRGATHANDEGFFDNKLSLNYQQDAARILV